MLPQNTGAVNDAVVFEKALEVHWEQHIDVFV